MIADHKAALRWATNGYHTHGSDCPECNLASAYLELQEAAKVFADWPPTPPFIDKVEALREMVGLK